LLSSPRTVGGVVVAVADIGTAAVTVTVAVLLLARVAVAWLPSPVTVTVLFVVVVGRGTRYRRQWPGYRRRSRRRLLSLPKVVTAALSSPATVAVLLLPMIAVAWLPSPRTVGGVAVTATRGDTAVVAVDDGRVCRHRPDAAAKLSRGRWRCCRYQS